MKQGIIIRPAQKEISVSLRSVRLKDAESLRKWKNANRQYFFHKEIISKDRQVEWLKDYFCDKNNFMFMVRYKNRDIGCIGFRKRPDGTDIYNVILADTGLARRGFMTQALRLLLKFIEIKFKRTDKIYVRVLKSNKVAIAWYKKNCFEKTGNFKNAHIMEWQGRA